MLAGVSFPGSKAHLANWVIDAGIWSPSVHNQLQTNYYWGDLCLWGFFVGFLGGGNIVWNDLFWFEGYPGGYPATTPTYTPNLYQTGSPGYPPGEHQNPHSWFDVY